MKGPISIEADNLRSTVRSLVENSHRTCFLKDARGKKHELFSFGTAAPPLPPQGESKGGRGGNMKGPLPNQKKGRSH